MVAAVVSAPAVRLAWLALNAANRLSGTPPAVARSGAAGPVDGRARNAAAATPSRPARPGPRGNPLPHRSHTAPRRRTKVVLRRIACCFEMVPAGDCSRGVDRRVRGPRCCCRGQRPSITFSQGDRCMTHQLVNADRRIRKGRASEGVEGRAQDSAAVTQSCHFTHQKFS